MHRHVPASLLLVPALALAACSDADAPAPASTPTAPAASTPTTGKELTKYNPDDGVVDAIVATLSLP